MEVFTKDTVYIRMYDIQAWIAIGLDTHLGLGLLFRQRQLSAESGKSVAIWGRGGMFRSVDLSAHPGYRMLRHELLDAS